MVTAPTTLRPIAPDYRALLEGVVADGPRVDAIAKETVERGLGNVFLVGSGGSLASLYQLQFLLECGAGAFSTFLHSSAEFNIRRPARLGPESLVIACSHRGQTPETVEAARIARGAGARVVAVTRDATSPLAELAHHALTYGRDEVVIDAKLIQLAMFGSRLVELTENHPPDTGLARAFAALPGAIVDAMEQREGANAATARQLRDEPITYVLAAGPSYGTAYSFAMCTLMEAQWMHAAAYNAAELFHGAFEVIEPGIAVIVLLDESAARPLAERALAFVKRYSDKVVVVDSRDLVLPGIDTGQRAVMTPIALGSVMYRLTAHYAAVRGRGLPDRRYMFKVPY